MMANLVFLGVPVKSACKAILVCLEKKASPVAPSKDRKETRASAADLAFLASSVNLGNSACLDRKASPARIVRKSLDLLARLAFLDALASLVTSVKMANPDSLELSDRAATTVEHARLATLVPQENEAIPVKTAILVSTVRLA